MEADGDTLGDRRHGLRAATDRRYLGMNALKNVGMRSGNGPSIHNSSAGWFSKPYASDLVSRLRGVIGLARVGVRLHALLQNSLRGDLRGSSRLGIFDYRGSLRRRRRHRLTVEPTSMSIASLRSSPAGARRFPLPAHSVKLDRTRPMDKGECPAGPLGGRRWSHHRSRAPTPSAKAVDNSTRPASTPSPEHGPSGMGSSLIH